MTFDFRWPAEGLCSLTLSLMHHDQTHTVTFSRIEHSLGDDRSAALPTNIDSSQMIERSIKVQLTCCHNAERRSSNFTLESWGALHLGPSSRRLRLPLLVSQDYDLKNKKNQIIVS